MNKLQLIEALNEMLNFSAMMACGVDVTIRFEPDGSVSITATKESTWNEELEKARMLE